MNALSLNRVTIIVVVGLKEKQPQNDYALSFESTANSSNVSNDGDNAGDENVGTTLPANLSSSQLSESAEPTSIAMTSPFVADEPIPPSIPSTPVSSSAKHVDSEQAEQAEALPAVAVTPAATPAAAPTGLLGSIVNTLGSAKKLATTPAVAAPPAAVTSAADSDKAAKDSNKDKEILLLKKTLKKKNAVRTTYLLCTIRYHIDVVAMISSYQVQYFYCLICAIRRTN